jgi:hypothetical protein
MVGTTELTPPDTIDSIPSFGKISSLPTGTGYSVLVEGFNSAVSATTPVVSGETDSVTITAGGTTPVSVICVPSASLLKTLDVSSGSASASLSLAVSGEQWYSLSLTSGTAYYFSQTNGNFAFALFSGNGAVEYGSATSYSSFTPGTSGTYYLVVASVSSASTDSTTVAVSTKAPTTYNEGSAASPIALTADQSHVFIIPCSGYSYYSFTPSVSGTYSLEVSCGDAITYGVYSDSSYSTLISNLSAVGAQFTGGVFLNGLTQGTTYYIELQDAEGESLLATGRMASPATIAGYSYQNVGTSSSPASLAVGTARTDTVGYHYYDSTSYYTFTTGAGLDYSLNLTAGTGYVYAAIYSDAAFSTSVRDNYDVGPSNGVNGSLLLSPNTKYWIVVTNMGANDGDTAPTTACKYSIEVCTAAVPNFTTLTPFKWTSGSNSSTSTDVWYSATATSGDTYELGCNDASNDSTTYSAYVNVDAYGADRQTSYFTDSNNSGSGLASHTFKIPSGQSTVYFRVHDCTGTYALDLVDTSTSGTISITAQ